MRCIGERRLLRCMSPQVTQIGTRRALSDLTRRRQVLKITAIARLYATLQGKEPTVGALDLRVSLRPPSGR